MALTLDAGKEQIKFNRALLHSGAIAGAALGLLFWSVSPFVAPKRSALHIAFRYGSLSLSLFSGAAVLFCGVKLEKNKLLYRAVETAERDDFIHQIAARQFTQQSQWDRLAAVEAEQIPQVLGAPTAEGTTDLPATGTTTEQLDGGKLEEVLEATEAGKSDTYIIENILGMKGRRYKEGKATLKRLRGGGIIGRC